jgi:hypothetical protein
MGIILGTIGAIASLAVTAVKSLGALGLAIQGLKVIGDALLGVAKMLGIVSPDRKVEDLGDRALQAEEQGIKPENFDTYEAYVKAIEGYKTDPEKSKLIPEEDKVKKGIELSAGVWMERFPDLPIVEFCKLAGEIPEYLTSDRMEQIEKMALDDGTCLPEIVSYLDGTGKNDVELEKAINQLMKVEKNVNPGISDGDALQTILNARKTE